jgi:hypothetical protein
MRTKIAQHLLIVIYLVIATHGRVFSYTANSQITDGHWEIANLPIQSTLFTGTFISPEDGWVFGEKNAYRLVGNNWTEYELPLEMQGYVLAAKLVDTNNGWAVGYEGRVFQWDGENWLKVATPAKSTDTLYGIDFISTKRGWIVGADNAIPPKGIMLEWDGQTWTKISPPTEEPILAIDILSATDGWAAGSENELIYWNGSRWNVYNRSEFDSVIFTSISMVAPDDGWAVGFKPQSGEGSIWHWNGKDWERSLVTKEGLYFVSMYSSNFGWAVGGDRNYSSSNKGLVLRWDGHSWLEYPSPPKIPLQFVWVGSETDGWMFGGGPTIFIDGNYDTILLRYTAQTISSPTPASAILQTPTYIVTPTPTRNQDVFSTSTLSPTQGPSYSFLDDRFSALNSILLLLLSGVLVVIALLVARRIK